MLNNLHILDHNNYDNPHTPSPSIGNIVYPLFHYKLGNQLLYNCFFQYHH